MVNVPPLLCSTPPPIDFGEDDDDSGLQSTLQLDDGEADEYSEYGLVTDTHDISLNAKVSELPELPISVEYSAQSEPPDLSIEPAKPDKVVVEAFNYQVKASDSKLTEEQEISISKEIDILPPVAEPNELQVVLEQQLEVDDEEEEANTNDNVPSLKLDSLSLYSSGSVTPPSTLSPVADEQTTKAPTVCHQVTLEDVTDDSDEECSPKKPKELFIPEGAPDFFAIEIVETPTQQTPSFNNQFPDAKPEPASAASQETDVKQIPPLELNRKIDEPKPEAQTEDDDFGDFADFSAAPSAVEDEKATSQDDGFDDFQDFATPATTSVPTQLASEDDTDDDFGDFAEPTFVPVTAAAAPALPQPPPPAAAHLSINERVKPVLEIMFPKLESNCAQSESNQIPLAETQTLHFGAIEQAHALSYQWSSSEMRHSLVRSLAIDSRNILFGDKWNASMPRFAANLSFDPLKPLKPLTATPGPNSSQQAPVASWRPANNSSIEQPLHGLEAAAAAAPPSQTKAQPSPANGQASCNDAHCSSDEATTAVSAACIDDGTAAASVFVAAAATAPLSPALSTDGNGHNFDDSGQFSQQQQQLDLRESPSPSPSPTPPPPPPSAVNSQQLHEVTSCNSSSNSSSNNNNNSFTLPLKETHIYTPSKSDTAVAKTTTLAPIDFDYEIASAGIIIDETVVKKEYRDVEYKPPTCGLDSPSKLGTTSKPTAEDDDFSDFQSMPAIKNVAQLQPPRNGTPTFGEQMILSPAILLPQSIPLAKPTIEWGDNALASINADELARIEELFSHQFKPPTISASVAQQSPKQQQQKQQQEDDEWSDFVSVPVQQQQQQNKNNNNVSNTQKARRSAPISAAAQKDDDWSDFVSSAPMPARAAPQFNSGAWQSANFYNNPLSLYQQQQQPHTHSNLVPKYQNNGSSSNNNNNSSNNNNNIPQQIHMMHDFSTAPTPTANAASATYQHQHHQHHQQQLQQQQQHQHQHQHHRQQFHLSNAKVAPRISLIPDLSFVAPTLPVNAGAFMSSLPKPSFSAKK
ncbi:uncharacterized protein LOC111601496 isoform X2 [Drosophila hydei]|uniref:Uncharacterized protein LOC111601496 isoform X2 n=1 Tax=Drosophila hydei TaxID=7224 RepID=A0A6J1M473_DROHY|nr:uncharacterized protein LOC111601496 isoform X2 [Drosophila hydei]